MINQDIVIIKGDNPIFFQITF